MFYSDFTARVGISPCIFCTEQIVFERKVQKKITNLNLKISLLDQCGWNFICIEILTEATNENIYTSQKKGTAGRDGISCCWMMNCFGWQGK